MKATKEQIQVLSRLNEQAAFDSLRKTKTRWVSKAFAVQAIPAESPDKLSYCVIASKKTAKHATDRNRMKRRLRSVITEILPTSAKRGMIYMLVARNDALTLPMTDMCNDLKWCLKKLGLTYDAS